MRNILLFGLRTEFVLEYIFNNLLRSLFRLKSTIMLLVIEIFKYYSARVDFLYYFFLKIIIDQEIEKYYLPHRLILLVLLVYLDAMNIIFDICIDFLHDLACCSYSLNLHALKSYFMLFISLGNNLSPQFVPLKRGI